MKLWTWICCGIVAVVAGTAIFAGNLAPADPKMIDPSERLIAPFTQSRHILGTDTLGRDILARLMYGSRTSAIVGILSTGIALVFGTLVGVVTGMARGAIDEFLAWMINIQLSIPAVVLAISISAVLGNGLWNVTIAITVALWPQFARIARGATLALMQRPFIEAARGLGAVSLRLALVHVLPNIVPTLVALATLEFGHAVVSEAALAFLGFGVEASRPSWGGMIAEGRSYLTTFVWLALLPSIVLSLLTVAVTYLADEIEARRTR